MLSELKELKSKDMPNTSKTENCYVKLLMYPVADDEYVLLYGFSVLTDLPAHNRKPENSKGKLIWKAVLNPQESKNFFDGLVKSGTITAGGKSCLTNGGLVEEKELLVNDREEKLSGPVQSCGKVIEYWNVSKKETLSKIKNTLGVTESEVYKGLSELVSWVKEESGIDLVKEGWRFGNFERYTDTKMASIFEVSKSAAQNDNIMEINIKKVASISSSVMVNCIVLQNGRSLKNELKELEPERDEISFHCSRSMDGIIVNIWDKESNKLIFSAENHYIKRLVNSMNAKFTPYKMEEAWSKGLHKSASNRKDIIDEKIETVNPRSHDSNIVVKDIGYDRIDDAYIEGRALFSRDSRENLKGCFIPNENKDGEIDSFLKIQEYMEDENVDKVVIVDPYFSVESASKMLGRIQRTDLQVDIITSLSNVDSDSEQDDASQCRNFLLKNKGILHQKLTVRNLIRGDSKSAVPVFHDRYLIRCYADGKKDGFLLSNSLNSMGQKYPFVIEPMDQEVCLSVCDYLSSICDENVQKGRPERLQIHCDILCDFEADKETSIQPVIEEKDDTLNHLKDWLPDEMHALIDEAQSDKHFKISNKELSELIATLMVHWEDDKDNICRGICLLATVVEESRIEELADILHDLAREIDFLGEFETLAKQKEVEMNFQKEGRNSELYKIWALLNGQADPSRQGFSMILEEAGHVYYRGERWLWSGYQLMIKMDPGAFVNLFKDIKSPLMYSILIVHLAFYKWDDSLYKAFIGTGDLFYQLTGAECLFQQMQDGDITNIQIVEILSEFIPEMRIFQMVCLLSQLKFNMRTKQGKGTYKIQWDDLFEQLLDFVAIDLPGCSKQTREKAIFWLFDPEAESNCDLFLKLAEKVSDSDCKKEIIEQELNVAESELIKKAGFNGDNSKLIPPYLTGLETLGQENAEQRLIKNMIKRENFEAALEPQLSVYAYKKYFKACKNAKMQMTLLKAFHEKYPQAEKVSEYLQKWEPFEDRFSAQI